MPIILGVVSQKGGVGKSSVTRMIAREFVHNGWDVKIADMDIQQGTSFHWSKTRAANNIEPLIRTETFSSVALALKDAAHFDLFIFDGAPAASAATRDIARAADLVLLPTGLCTDDMRPQVLLAHELTKAGVPAAKLRFVLCRVGDSETEIKEARDYITGAGYKVLDGELPERALYRRASDAGRSFTESRHRGLNQRADIVVQNIAEALKQLPRQTSEVA
jgi:chromosome partitioning protein